MARHNFVYLYARVTKNPKLATDENGMFTRGQAVLTTIRGTRTSDVEDDYKSYKFDCPVILTKNPVIMENMAKWEPNDIVMVKGALSSRDTTKQSICKECGKINTRPGTVVYITPIHIKKVMHCPDEESAIEELKRNCEISNQCFIVGNVCENPSFFKDDTGNCQTQYNLAINRKFRVKTDPATLDTDYPHVKSYGTNAINDAMFIQVGASVLIDGFLQTRQFPKKCTCSSCGSNYETTDQAMEIVPYATEYLANCREMDEIETLKKKQVSEAFEDIFDVRPNKDEEM